MSKDIRLKEKIIAELKTYKKIALYGTGKMARYIMPIFEELNMLDRIVAIIDRDDSSMIGQNFMGYKVYKYTEIMDKIDAIVIVTTFFWREIETRLEALEEEHQLEIPVISIYDYSPKKLREHTSEDYREYVEYIENRQLKKDEFVMDMPVSYLREKKDAKIIAWYLPQYYQMDVNDRFHGKGFTEWTNSSQAIPLYNGHNQPHIPYDVGYYSLESSKTMKRQVELAKKYGIYGFAIHYYWFSGEKTMEQPLYMLLENKELDIPFCLNWATENWTTAWDGGQFDVIFEQKCKEDDAIKFMQDILPFFKDDRYIKIDGKPLLIIYTLDVFPETYTKEMLKTFRAIAKENGFPDLYILVTNFHEFDGTGSKDIGIDGLVEFPPSYMFDKCENYIPKGYINPYFGGRIYDLEKYVQNKYYLRKYKTTNVFRSALVAFDNTARKSRWGGIICHGANPQLYKTWLKDILEENLQYKSAEENFVFVNSWNEWAEGSHLEPDVRLGYANLVATCQALYEARGLNTLYIEKKVNEICLKGYIPHFYVLCIESMGDVIACEPIARVLKEKYENALVTWIVKKQYVEIIKYNPYIDSLIEINSLGEAIDVCEHKSKDVDGVIVNCHYNARRCTLTNRIHTNYINPQINEQTYFDYGALLESFSLTAGMERISMQPVFHEKENIGEKAIDGKYIVIHCKSAEFKKDWQSSKWKKLIKELIEMGHKVVEIGLEPVVQLGVEEYIDLTGEKDIQEIAQIIKNAELFIGIDSAFAHIANCFMKKSLILLGAYKNFKKPMPYTGYFREHEEKYLLYSDTGTVKEVLVGEVINRLRKLL